MGLMSKMISKMSPEKKQAMMLNMMPKMLEDVDVLETMVKMLPDMARNISLLDIISMLKKLLEGIGTLKNSFPKLIKKMPEMMELMSTFMPEMMGKMMPFMMENIGMDKMSKNCDKMMCRMMEVDSLKELMPQMMKKMMPVCLNVMLPHMPKDDRREFVQNMHEIMNEQEHLSSPVK